MGVNPARMSRKEITMKKNTNTIENVTAATVIPTPSDIKQDIASSLVKTAPSCAGVKYSIVPIRLMELPFYQRQEQALVNKIASEWNDTLCGVISLSWRDNKLWIVDGQNRVAAAKLAGKTELICTIATGLSEQEEFWYFANQNKNVVKVSAYDIVTGGARIGSEPFTSIMRCITEMGFEAAPRGGVTDGKIVCMDRVLQIWKAHGEDGLKWILRTIRECGWQYAQQGCSAAVLSALSTVYGKNMLHLNAARTALVKGLGGTNPMVIVAKAVAEHPTLYRSSGAVLRAVMAKCIQDSVVPQLA